MYRYDIYFATAGHVFRRNLKREEVLMYCIDEEELQDLEVGALGNVCFNKRVGVSCGEFLGDVIIVTFIKEEE